MNTELRIHTAAFSAALLLALAAATPGVAASGQPGHTPPAAPLHLTLDQAVGMAVAENPGLKAMAHRTSAAAETARAVARERWGDLRGVARDSRFNDDQIVRPISSELLARGFAGLPFDRNQLHYGLELEVPLYLGGQLSNRIAVARLEQEKVAALAAGTRWQVRFNATSLYAAGASLDASLAALDQLVAALQRTETRLEMAVAAGKRPDLDRLKVIEELDGARAERAGAASDRVRVGALLAALLGRDPSTPLELAPLPSSDPLWTTPPGQVRALVDATTPVRQAQLAMEQADHGVRIARGAFLPTVALRANLMEHAAPSLDSALNTWEVSAGVVVPLFAGGTRFSRRAAAKELLQAAAHAVDAARLRALADLEAAMSDLSAAQAQAEASQARVAAGTEAARIEQIRFDHGAGTVEDLLRAHAREESARAALARARGSLVTAAERVNSIVEKEVVQ